MKPSHPSFKKMEHVASYVCLFFVVVFVHIMVLFWCDRGFVGRPLYHFSLLSLNVISSLELIQLNEMGACQSSLLFFLCGKTELIKTKKTKQNKKQTQQFGAAFRDWLLFLCSVLLWKATNIASLLKVV